MENAEKQVLLTPCKAIRSKCLDCVCGNSNEVKLCPSIQCPLHPYRFGRKPDKSEYSAVRKVKKQPPPGGWPFLKNKPKKSVTK